MITFDQDTQCFHLSNAQISYVVGIAHGRYLVHHYWGKKIRQFSQVNGYPRVDRSSFSPTPADWPDRNFSLDTVLQEYPGHGAGDYREPAFEMRYADGSRVTNLHYTGHEIFSGKPSLDGLPACWVADDSEAQSLGIYLSDPVTQLEVILLYTIYADRAVITRSATLVNHQQSSVHVERALSMAVDFCDSRFEMIQLPGAWARERTLVRTPLHSGIQMVDSKRGASSVQQQPFVALARPETTEHSGDVYGFHLVYSGNFTARVEVDPFSQTRVLMGINPHDFSWLLEPGQTFQTPETVMIYSPAGLNGLSQTLHSLYRERLARGPHAGQLRPILANNWESTYFDFDEQKLLAFADNAHQLGVELLMLDDGWFGQREDDTSSLGDWEVNRAKFPHGMENLIGSVQQKGMKFGLWFEPEMISPNSQLYRQHPDWAIHVPGQPTSEGRNQYVLDLSRQEVRDEITQRLTDILTQLPIDYIKWDMNRNLTEVGSATAPAAQQSETAHRYMLGLYQMLETLTSRFPHILLENCSGGGGRFDPGMVYYMPQSWVSDNTDAVARLQIQYGTSLLYPPVMMCAHVSESPNHQVGRQTSMAMRGDVAMSGNYGLMLDLLHPEPQRDAAVKQQIAFYKQHRALLQQGTFHRLISPFDGSNHAAWMFTRADQQEAMVFVFQTLALASAPFLKVKLCGLLADKTYRFSDSGLCVGGDELMTAGVFVDPPLRHDFESRVWHLTLLP